MNTTTYFENEGVRRQITSLNLPQAIKQFKNSCYICLVTGKNIKCKNCAIRNAAKNNIEYVFPDQVTPEILKMVKEEEEEP